MQTQQRWFDGPRPVVNRINLELREASDAFNLAYRQSLTWDDMDTHLFRTIRALRRTQRIVRNQQVLSEQGLH